MEKPLVRVALVGCTKSKHDSAMPAKELFAKSPLFQLTRTYIELSGYDSWFILSTLHGLTHPDTVLEPYEYTLTAKQRIRWSRDVARKLKEVALQNKWEPNHLHFDLFVNYPTAKSLVPMLREEFGEGPTIDRPYAGRGRIGSIQSWLQSEIEKKLTGKAP